MTARNIGGRGGEGGRVSEEGRTDGRKAGERREGPPRRWLFARYFNKGETCENSEPARDDLTRGFSSEAERSRRLALRRRDYARHFPSFLPSSLPRYDLPRMVTRPTLFADRRFRSRFEPFLPPPTLPLFPPSPVSGSLAKADTWKTFVEGSNSSS